MSLDENYSAENIFAKIIRGDMPCAKVTETDDVLAFMDAFPESEGHTLVIPKIDDATNILTVKPKILSILIIEVQRIAKAVKAALNPHGIKIIQFNGAPAGQTVFHIHFHIIPTWSDRSPSRHSQGMANLDDLNITAAKIAANL